jgi:hypothetical protein
MPSCAVAGGISFPSKVQWTGRGNLVKHSRFEMLVLVRLLLLLRFALGVGFRLLVLLLLSFDFSVHTGNTSFGLIDVIGRAKGTGFSICQIDFFYQTE